MQPELTIQQFKKNVAIWSGRKKRKVVVAVDYQSIQAGDFTLIHIARMRDSAGNDTFQTPLQASFLD